MDGRLFYFWSLSWQTLEGFATGTLRNWAFAPASVYHAKVLYARSDEMVERLVGLKDQVDSLQREAARPQVLRRALGKFVEVQAHMAELRQAQHEGHLVSIRCASWQVAAIAAAWSVQRELDY
ncbi:MAG: hypothetical protein ACI906_000896 [Candidatus Latescibacterota bacterium]